MTGPKTGFVVPVRTAEITFQGTDYDGAVIECLLDVSLDWFFEIQRAVSDDSDENEKMTMAWADRCLISWNLTDGGRHPDPVRPGPHFMAQPTAFTTTIMSEWQKAAAEPASPLSPTSRNGSSSGAASTPKLARFITKPAALAEAEIVDTLAQRYGVLPGAILQESTALLRLVATVEAGRPDGE